MSKTKPEIAKAILERRNRMTHVIMPGEINAAIGADGVAEALRERWLVPDMDSGFLCATNDLVKVEEMRKLAEMKPEEYKPEAIPVMESHACCVSHSKRREIVEIAAPMTGKDSPGLGAIGQPQSHDVPPAPAAPVAPAAPPPSTTVPAPAAPVAAGFGIGNPVTASRGGATATGMIEKLMPDGRYQVGFGANAQGRPPGDNIYGKDELSAIPAAPQG